MSPAADFVCTKCAFNEAKRAKGVVRFASFC